MHITFELETALQWEFKVFLFVRQNSHYQMGTNYLVFQNFCIHFPFSAFSSPCKSLQECCPLQTDLQNKSNRQQRHCVQLLYCIIPGGKVTATQLSGIKHIQSFTNTNEKVTVSSYEHILRFRTHKLHLIPSEGTY